MGVDWPERSIRPVHTSCGFKPRRALGSPARNQVSARKTTKRRKFANTGLPVFLNRDQIARLTVMAVQNRVN